MDTDPNFGNDLASRYGQALEPTWQERETTLARDIKTEGSLAGFLVEGMPRMEDEIVYLVRSGKIAEAQKKYSHMWSVIDTNFANISSVGAMDARNGTNAAMLVQQANRAQKREFDNVEVDLVDGSGKMTIGRVFNDPELIKNPGKSFEDRGFYREDVDAFLNSPDEGLRRALGYFMKDAQYTANNRLGVAMDAMHIQNNEAAHAVHKNWQDISDTFGDGATRFVQYVYATHKESGAAAPMVKSLLELGKAHAAATRLSGSALTDSLFGAYRDLVFSAYKGDPDAEGSTTRNVTPNKRMQADALITRTLAKMATRDPSAYSMKIDDPLIKKGLGDAVALIEEASADGIDLVREAANGGQNLYDLLATDMADLASGISSESIPARWRRFTDGLKRQFTGGRDFAHTVFDQSGDALDYLKLSRSAGGTSTTPAADGISAAVVTRLRRTFAADIFAGKTPYEAWTAMQTDPAKVSAAIGGMTDDLSRYFSGKGARSLATQLAESVFNAFSRGGRVNIETLLRDAANNENLRRAAPLAYQSARDWFYGNVAAPLRYAKELADLDAHVASSDGGGLNPRDRAAYMSRMRSRLGEMERLAESGYTHVNPRLMLREQLNHGYYYDVEDAGLLTGPDGRPVLDDQGRPRRQIVPVRNWSNNLQGARRDAMRRTGVSPVELRRQYEERQALKALEAKRIMYKEVDRQFEEKSGQ